MGSFVLAADPDGATYTSSVHYHHVARMPNDSCYVVLLDVLPTRRSVEKSNDQDVPGGTADPLFMLTRFDVTARPFRQLGQQDWAMLRAFLLQLLNAKICSYTRFIAYGATRQALRCPKRWHRRPQYVVKLSGCPVHRNLGMLH